MSVVAKLATSTDWQLEIAEALETVAAQLRAGELTADHGVLVLGNDAGGTARVPQRLGRPSSPSEVMGWMLYGSHHLFQAESGG